MDILFIIACIVAYATLGGLISSFDYATYGGRSKARRVYVFLCWPLWFMKAMLP